MELHIENFRGIESADITIAPLAIVGGANAAGKSSVAQAFAAALTGTVTPVPGINKNSAGMFVRAGTGGGLARVTVEQNSVSVNWPAGKIRSEGTPPSASAYAAGMRSLTDLDGKERAAELISMLKASPDRADLERSMKGTLDAENIGKLWEVIQRDGWDTRYKNAKETGARLKGQWEAVTAARYGEKKAEQWIPADWSPDLAGASEETLAGLLAQEREGLEAAIAGAAVDAAELERLREQIAAAPDEAAVAAAKAAHEEAKSAAIIAREELAALHLPGAPEDRQPCPHCGNPLVVRGSKVALPAPSGSEYEDADYRARHDMKRCQVQELNLKAEAAADEFIRVQSARNMAALAAKKLAELEARPVGGGDVDAARGAVKRAEDRLQAFKAKARADDLCRSIAVNQAVVAMLAPDGLRQEKLQTALKAFNSELAHLCETAQWGTVEISPDLEFSYARRPWVILSESERYRVRATLQAAIASMDGSAAVIFDGADILDRQGRNGLARLAQVVEGAALICMTLKDPSELPDLDGAGVGRAYWVSDARSHPRAVTVTTTICPRDMSESS